MNEYFVINTKDNSFLVNAGTGDARLEIDPVASPKTVTKDAETGEYVYSYTMVQFESAYFDTTGGSAAFQIIYRQGGPRANSFSAATAYQDMQRGEVAQFTFISYTKFSDEANSTGYAYTELYRNGVKLHTTGKSNNGAFDLTTGYYDLFRFYGYGGNYIIDNVYFNQYTSHPAVLGDDGRYTFTDDQFSDPDYVSNFTGVPAFATVDGVAYNSVAALNAALAKKTGVANIEFLHDYTATPWYIGEKVTLNANSAVINTNGFVDAEKLELLNCSVVTNGNEISVYGYNYANNPLTTPSATTVKEAIKSPVPGSEDFYIQFSEFDAGEWSIYSADSNDFFVVNRTDSSKKPYFDITPSAEASKPTSTHPYMVIQFDAAYFGDSIGGGSLQPIYKVNNVTGGTSMGAATLFKDMKPGEVAQFTYVFTAVPDSTDETKCSMGYEIYRNGELLVSREKYYTGTWDAKSYHHRIRVYMDTSTFAVDNVYANHFTSYPVAKDAEGKLTIVNENGVDDYQFTKSEYKKLEWPTIATIGGVEYSNVASLNAELAKTDALPVNVELLHNYTTAPWAAYVTGGKQLTVHRSACINTNAFIGNDEVAFADGATPVVNGNYINAHYSNLVIKDGSPTNFANALISNANDNDYGVTAKPEEAAKDAWDIITIDGRDLVYLHSNDVGVHIRFDFDAKNNKILENPAIALQFELIKTGEADGLAIDILARTASGNYNFVNANLTHWSTLLKNVEIGELAQVTLMMVSYYDDEGTPDDVSDDTFYPGVKVFVNGEKMKDAPLTDRNNNKLKKSVAEFGATAIWYGFRVNFSSTSGSGMDAILGNVYTNTFSKDLTDLFDENGNLSDKYSVFAKTEETGHKALPALPYVAIVDSVAHTYATIDAVLADGGNHTVELLHQPLRTLTVNSSATIKTNGYTGIVVGSQDYYVKSDENGVLTIAEDDRTTNITFAIDGEAVATYENVLYNSDHSVLINKITADNVLHHGKVFVKDGKYYDLNWNLTRPEYSENITYNVTPTLNPILAVDTTDKTNHKLVTNRIQYTDGVLTKAVFNDIVELTLYFNEDINSTAVYSGNFIFLNAVWEMNGHTFKWHMPASDDTSHGITLANGAIFKINNGNFDLKNGSSFFGSSNGQVPSTSLILTNVNISKNSLIADWRAGTLTLNNCNINGGHFMIGARTSTKTRIVFNGGSIVTSTGNGALISYHNNDGWETYGKVNEETGKLIDAQLPNVDRHVTFNGTKIYLQGALVSMKEEKFSVDKSELGYNNRHVTFVNCEVYATVVYAGGNCDGKVIFGDNVKYTINSFGAEVYTADESIKLGVKDNDMAYEFLATKDYATVIWDENTTEYWAAGSIPTASKAAHKNHVVYAVEAGKTHELTAGNATDYALTVNLTLENNIFYNIYADGATAVYVNGKKLEASTIQGVTRYSYELLPASALGEIHVVIEFEGATYSRTTNLMQYVNQSAKGASDELKYLYSAMLTYLLEVQEYDHVMVARAAANEFVKANSGIATPDEMDPVEDNMTALFNSVYCYLDGSFNLVFNTKFNGEVTVTAGDEEFIFTAENNLLVVTLPAYALAEDLMFTVGDVTATYNLAAYAQSLNGDSAYAVVEALFNYAYNAKAYAESEQ